MALLICEGFHNADVLQYLGDFIVSQRISLAQKELSTGHIVSRFSFLVSRFSFVVSRLSFLAGRSGQRVDWKAKPARLALCDLTINFP
jgi:hypothetical protein